MKQFIVLLLLLSVFNGVEAKQKSSKKVKSTHITALSNDQRKILTSAYTVAKNDGLKNPKILPGILMQESAAGSAKNFRTSKHKPAFDQTVGLGQIKLSTAKSILKENPDLKSKMKSGDLKRELAHNDSFNISIASRYLKDLSKSVHTDSHLIAAYNLGLGGAQHLKNPDKLQYVRNVKNHMSRINL